MRMKTAGNVVPSTAVGAGGMSASVTNALGFASAIQPDRQSCTGTTINQTITVNDNTVLDRTNATSCGPLFENAKAIERISNMKREGHRAPVRTFLMRTLSFAAASALILNHAISPVIASDYRASPAATEISSGGQLNAKFLALGIGKSVVVDLPRDVKDVLVADPKIANAVVRSAQRAYIIGAAVGQTNIIFFDSTGQQIAAYDIAVTRDLNGVRAALKQTLPYADVRIEGVGDGVVLTGSVSNPAEAQQAQELAARLAGGADKVYNNIAVRGRDQVMLKVTVAEMQRSIIKQLGVDLSAQMNYGTAVVDFNNVAPFTALGRPLTNGSVTGNFGTTITPKGAVPSVTATVRAMENAGVVRTLAEPNLTAISGESATFIAGGEFPIPSGVTCQNGGAGPCQPSITFKKFGISLNFTPVVLTEGRISLRVMTEVSEIANDNSISISGFSIPSIKTRRAETTLEIPSGGSMAMAGLIQDQTKQAMSGLPGLAQVPVLGALFKSRDFINNQTELMVIVTPYVVRAVAQKDLSRPDDGFAESSDPQADFLGTVSRIYGVPNRNPQGRSYRGTYGFITD
ncbi:pilus assembly protein CpaC [Nitrobacteraceae bacterium AZCC 1564]